MDPFQTIIFHDGSWILGPAALKTISDFVDFFHAIQEIVPGCDPRKITMR